MEYEVYSGQGDQSVLKQIGDQAVADGVDAIIPIATLAAQVMTVCAEDTQTPVIFAAISDPEAAELTGIDYVTGTSDALNTEFILDMMLAQNPGLSSVGLLYSLSEANSITPIAGGQGLSGSQGHRLPGNDRQHQLTRSSPPPAPLSPRAWTPSSPHRQHHHGRSGWPLPTTLTEAGIPHYTGADSFVRNGAFVTCGVNYTDLGTHTADLAYDAVTDGMDGLETSTRCPAASSPSTPTPPPDWASTIPSLPTWARWWRSPPPRKNRSRPILSLPAPGPAPGDLGVKGEAFHALCHTDRAELGFLYARWSPWRCSSAIGCWTSPI